MASSAARYRELRRATRENCKVSLTLTLESKIAALLVSFSSLGFFSLFSKN
ncbi:transmembrane protein, putative [Medicago truncatula]|uniref:Transmembrane protein, putative n=1 Tax=Medicago truncatula TaxID=3880 RepID=A0A072TIF9_MEDTR|nr:transmembrane protein, putative [Medicago truncatula]